MNEKIQSSALTPDSAFTAECFKLIAEALPRDKYVKVKGLGTFKLIMVEPRESVDVNTGERILISGHPKVTFTPDTVLRDIINEPFACFETTIINDFQSAEEPLVPEEAWDSVTLADTTIGQDTQADVATPEIPTSRAQRESELSLCRGAKEITRIEKPLASVSSPRDFLGWGFFCKLLLAIVVCGICYIFNSLSPDIWNTNDTFSHEAIESEASSIVPSPDAVSMLRRPDNPATPTPLTRDQLTALHPDDPKVTECDTTQLRIVGTLDAHTLEYGETLAGISLRYYGRRCYWPYIAIHNHLNHAHRTLTGTVIQVPRLALNGSDSQ